MEMKLHLRRATAVGLAALMAASLMACGEEKPDPSTSATTPSVTTAPPATTVPDQTTAPAETTLPPETQPATVYEGLDALRLRMEPSGAVAGIIFLGYTDQSMASEDFLDTVTYQHLLEEYPFIRQIPAERMAQNSGGQVFCIVPFDPAAKISICDWDTDTSSPGSTILELQDGAPFLIQCNSSDILPNTAVSITDNFANNLVDYCPAISLKDGTVTTPSGDDDPLVLDFTGIYPDDPVEPDDPDDPVDPDDPDDPDDPVLFNEGLDEIRLAMEPSAAIAAVIHLGFTDYGPEDAEFFHDLDNQAALLKYPFILETPLDHYSRNDGSEVFCIVPADPDAHVEVYFWDGGNDVLGDLVYTRDSGDPIILQGNISDILPNLAVTIVDSYGNTLYQYHPQTSLRDGKVITPRGDDDPVVLDMTGY